ncbi:hypothetical protein B0H19DRAFT_1066006 [Mycena capillaripes]|nr:hypothetical protein B0H19DRAFT_1066006 [Mycena capillaripes]
MQKTESKQNTKPTLHQLHRSSQGLRLAREKPIRTDVREKEAEMGDLLTSFRTLILGAEEERQDPATKWVRPRALVVKKTEQVAEYRSDAESEATQADKNMMQIGPERRNRLDGAEVEEMRVKASHSEALAETDAVTKTRRRGMAECLWVVPTASKPHGERSESGFKPRHPSPTLKSQLPEQRPADEQ